ncbi:hypothetical protein ANG2_0485 [Streptococcus constellatus subsp. constellatus SK53]|nr:hypothetical protein ANG2_0485 [Streptococcus constellatus subsp. constellatus SK53]
MCAYLQFTRFENLWVFCCTIFCNLSYEKQENKARALVLHASQIEAGEIKRMYHAIHLIDNTDFLSTLDNPKSYNDAKGGNDKFEI